MQLTEWLDGYQRRHRWVGFPVAVIYKLFEDHGPYLAALITFYGFLSLFPLLLLLTSLLGFLLQGDSDLQQRILDSTLSQFPIIGDQLNDPQSLHGSGTAVVIGVLVALYGALGVAQALQHAMNVAWAVPRTVDPTPSRHVCAACCSSRPPASPCSPQRSCRRSAAAPEPTAPCSRGQSLSS